MSYHFILKYQENEVLLQRLEENIKNPFERNGRDFIFEDKKDAVNFILRWM